MLMKTRPLHTITALPRRNAGAFRYAILRLAVAALAALTDTTATAQSDLNGNNLTILQSAYFGSIFTDTAATTTAEGLRLDASQDVAENYHSSTTPGYWQENWVTVEDYGDVTYGHWEAEVIYQIVGYNYIDPVYDSEGNIITEGYTQDVWDYVSTGNTIWVVDGTTWGVTGTHQENQPVWVNEVTNTWTETVAGVPRVRFNATRSDTNFVFRVPSPGSGTDDMKDVFVVWQGGITVPYSDASRTSVLMGDAIQHTLAETGGSTTTRMSAEVTALTATAAYTDADGAHVDTSESELRPSLLKFTRTESVDGAATVAQTQIAAKSASFAGVVEVNGNLKVQGAALIAPQGDLLMGAYTNGPQP
jgi:hypothetical protein